MRTNRKPIETMLRYTLLSCFAEMLDEGEESGWVCVARHNGKTVYRIKIEKEEITDEKKTLI